MPRQLLSAFALSTLLCTLCATDSLAMIMRNNALINKMVSNFQDNHVGEPSPDLRDLDAKQHPEKVISIMQTVLCRNFPTIPCQLIIEDEALRILIEKSIQQIQYKKLKLEKTTIKPGYPLTLFPVVNSEDLSSFLKVQDLQQYYGKEKKKDNRKHKGKKSFVTHWSKETPNKVKKRQKTNDAKKKNLYSGRKMRKFYPHKVKYKDKADKHPAIESDEKLSVSVENPDIGNKRHHLNYKEPEDPVWRIDYMKHGEPSMNKVGFMGETLNPQFTKTGPNVIVDEGVLEQRARKDVLHPDVYIKKNFVRKNHVDNSEGTE